MGVYSTISLTREKAMSLIYERLEKASDDQIEAVLFALFGEQELSNYWILTPEQLEKAKEAKDRYLE